MGILGGFTALGNILRGIAFHRLRVYLECRTAKFEALSVMCTAPSGFAASHLWPAARCPVISQSQRSLCFRQGEDIDGVPHQRAIALKGEHAAGPDLRAAAIIAGWDGH